MLYCLYLPHAGVVGTWPRSMAMTSAPDCNIAPVTDSPIPPVAPVTFVLYNLVSMLLSFFPTNIIDVGGIMDSGVHRGVLTYHASIGQRKEGWSFRILYAFDLVILFNGMPIGSMSWFSGCECHGLFWA